MYESSKCAILLEGEKLDTFKIEQGMALGCNLSPILFSVEQTRLAIQLK